MKKWIVAFWLLSLPAWAFSVPEPVWQGTFVYGQAAPREKVYYRGVQAPMDTDGTFLVAIGRNETEAVFTVKKGLFSKTQKTIPVQKRQWKKDVVTGLPVEKITPPPELTQRLAKEQQLLDEARSARHDIGLPRCFQWPLKGTRISAPFGAQRIYNGTPHRPHSGTDIAAPMGSPIKATADGIVILSEEDLFYTGQTVLIDHGSGVQSGYSHMSKRFVKLGDTVKAGDVIGEVGTTGRSTGPHLHFTLAWENIRIDPETILTDRCP